MRRSVRTLVRGLGAAAVFVLGAAGAVALHVDTPTFRRLAMGVANAALASAVHGRVVIERIGALGLGRIDGVDAHAEDPNGLRVVRVEGVRGRLSTWALVRSLAGSGNIVVDISDVTVDRADVDLDTNADGVLALARAFEPRTTTGGAPGRGVSLRIASGHVESGRAHGLANGVVVDADVSDADAAVSAGPGTVTVDVTRAQVAVRTRIGTEIRGGVAGHITRPSPSGGDLQARARWSGTLGGVAGSADVTYDGGKITATVDLPPTSPQAACTVWPTCPFTEPASAHVEAAGTWPRLDVTARASIGAGSVELRGPVDLAPPIRAQLHVQASDVDTHALSVAAPTSDLSGTGALDVTLGENGAARAEVSLAVAAGTVASTRTPPVTLQAGATVDASGRLTSADGALGATERGATVRLNATLAPQGESYRLQVDGNAAAALDSLPRLPPVARGQATAKVHGTLDLGTRRLDATVDASANGIERDGQRAATASLTARATGPLDAPQFDVDLHAKNLVLGGRPFDELEIQAHGTPQRAPVLAWLSGAGVEAKVEGDMTIDRGVTLRDVHASAHRDADRAWSQTRLVRLASDELRVEDAVIEGLGTPLHVDVRKTTSTLELRAQTERLDLASATRLVGGPALVGGTLAIDVDASITPGRATGRLVADVAKVPVTRLGEANAHVDARLDGRHASGKATASVADVGTLTLESSSIEVGGSGPLSLSSWKRAWGAIDVTTHVDLAALAARLPPDRLPVAHVAGVLDATAHVERDSESDDTPDVALDARTTGLAIDGARAAWTLRGTDLTVRARADGRTGETHVDGDVRDGTGPLLALRASSKRFPYGRLVAADAPTEDVLRTLPFDATLDIPSRGIATLPAWLGLGGDSGEVDANVVWTGPVNQPVVRVVAHLRNGRADRAVATIRVDLDLDASYDGSRVDASLSGSSRGDSLLDATATIDARASDVVDALRDGTPVPWIASGNANLTAFPLQSLGALDDRQVSGRASGRIVVEHLHDDARGSADLTSDDLHVGDVACKAAHVQASIGDGVLDGTARVDQDDGYGELHAHAGVIWGRALKPALDETKPIDVSLGARQLRVALLLPFVPRLFSSLDGRIDADLRDHIDPAANTMRPEGSVTLRDGTMEMQSLGGELRDVTAKLTATPDGVIRLDGVSARGLSGHIEAAASGRLQGLGLGAANAAILIPAKEPLPIIFDGVQVGTLDGRFDVVATRARDGSRLDVDVSVPTMRMQLPLTAAHDVQTLGQLTSVDVGLRRGPSDFTPVSLDGESSEATASAGSPGMPVRVAVKLGENVEVKRGTDLDLRLTGGPTVTIGQTLLVEGQITLSRGTIQIQGKPFNVDKGTVSFVGDDPTNPQVVLSASWTAADGTRVYADFVGPLKTGKVELRSEPALPKNEVIALILFGTADGSQGASSQNSPGGQGTGAGSAAAGAAGSAAAAPVNQALGNVNRVLDNVGMAGGLTAKIDTSAANPRPEVELQIARDISLQVAVVLGVPPPGTNPDTTLVTLNWRFLRKWSLEATWGNANTSILDVVWQHRY
jgi:translocation and assembly module TamB